MSEEVFQQNLDESKAERPGGPLAIELLFREPAAMLFKERMCAVVEKHVGKAECFRHDGKTMGFAALDYRVEFQDQSVPVQLTVMVCTAFDGEEIDNFFRSQMWGCFEEKDRILGSCRYRVIATDMLTRVLPAVRRTTLDTDFLETLSELHSDCETFYSPSFGKLFTAESVRRDEMEGTNRFIYFGINVCFFNVQDSEDTVVDTFGMSTPFLSDLQYHFHGMNPNWVVNHVYNVAAYLFGSGNVIAGGETADGAVDGEMSSALHWSCRREAALIQPPREVLDINMGECAPGMR